MHDIQPDKIDSRVSNTGMEFAFTCVVSNFMDHASKSVLLANENIAMAPVKDLIIGF